uniref:DUF148 domain-containing protein n=1 Tax=Bursaphelenchus xylophilus TaxID=6326 RepID=A0A1I7SS09_BURXY
MIQSQLPTQTPFIQIYDRLTECEIRDLHKVLGENKDAPRHVFKQEVDKFVSKLDPEFQRDYKRIEEEMEKLEIKEKEEKSKILSHNSQTSYGELAKALNDDPLSELQQIQLVHRITENIEPEIIQELKSSGIVIPRRAHTCGQPLCGQPVCGQIFCGQPLCGQPTFAASTGICGQPGTFAGRVDSCGQPGRFAGSRHLRATDT